MKNNLGETTNKILIKKLITKREVCLKMSNLKGHLNPLKGNNFILEKALLKM